jgi:hypothetical protein
VHEYILIGRRNNGRSKTGWIDQEPLIRNNVENAFFLVASAAAAVAAAAAASDDDDGYMASRRIRR